MTDFIRTPDANFATLADFAYPPAYHVWQDMRMHYIDVGPRDGPVVLMLHGMPAWCYLYRDIIPPLVAAGFRCIAPDHMGFGKSDKPTDLHWYTIARHTEILSSLITELDLKRITLMCQDWGGPTGLAQAAMMPERFERLVIMNTWLHHTGFEYSEAIRTWNRHWREGGLFCRPKPNVAALFVFSAGLINRDEMVKAFVSGATPNGLDGEGVAMYAGFSAPFKGLDDHAYNGLRRFPLSIPVDEGHNGNAVAQAHHYEILLKWPKPAHFIWGIEDDVFTQAWGREWCDRMGGTSFDAIPGAGHFLQNTHGAAVAGHLLRRIREAA
jgi:haloalkane dehalogenase